MEQTKIKASLVIEGEELNPDYVTQILELSPTKSWSKGDIIKEDRKRSCGSWTLSIGYEGSYDITIQINKLYKCIEGKEDKIKLIKQKYCGLVILSIVIEVENQKVPGIVIEEKISKLMASIEADIDIDIYLIS